MVPHAAADLDDNVRAFFDAAVNYCDTWKMKFAAQYGVSLHTLRKIFPKTRWEELQRGWLLERVRRATDEVFIECNLRDDFTQERILRRLQNLWVHRGVVLEDVAAAWRTRRVELPTKEDKVQAIIDRLIAEGIPADEINSYKLRKELGTGFDVQADWVVRLVRKAKRHQLKQAKSLTRQLHAGATAMSSSTPGSRLYAEELDLRYDCDSQLLRRALLRPDIAEVAWPLLYEAALSGRNAPSTITQWFRWFRAVGELFGEQIPDATKATLRKIQAMWVGGKDKWKPWKRDAIKTILLKLFNQLVILAEDHPGIDRREMLLISGWLSLTSHSKKVMPGDVLSADELDAVISACLADVKGGMDFISEGPELLSLGTKPAVGPNAAPLVRWGIALMILIMLLTGLRRQSVIRIKVGDWVALHPNMFALVWRHGKKREEHAAVLPATLAGLLDDYARANHELRNAFGTEWVFILASKDGYWQAEPIPNAMSNYLRRFVKRHSTTRAGKLVKLTSQITRRTFVTRGLYEGQSIWALRLQLGHRSLTTTMRYGKFDVFEHPAQVGPALDIHGLRALSLWRGPVVLNDLGAAEREQLLALRPERDQGVGLCRHGSCKKIDEGPLPPCSLCEHLVTGREFFGAWDVEQARRESGLVKLEGMSEMERTLSHRRQQYALFMSNYARLKGESA